ncbi:MAG: 16S rRNA (guanine(527)-N(7))-methyltransferase RsmG [Alphaproteobacteria bacterium]|nr:16S rRNA (guanine(527)-N(7))-methyltransferase RsmG [Alphaproteobacteria bacterium]
MSIDPKIQFQKNTDVSRETMEQLEAYAALLLKWQPKINLISKNTIPELWTRHFLDSAQLIDLCPSTAKTLIDLGSGAGFPGLVLAIMSEMTVHLIESDTRKSAFLREAARIAGVSDRVTVHATRAEAVDLPPADIISARALASLSDLLPLAHRFWGEGTIALFPKGKRYKEELTAANYAWYITYDAVRSRSDDDSVLLRLTDMRPKPSDHAEGGQP